MVKTSGSRTGHVSSSASLNVVLTVILLAFAGQFFLAQAQIPWTLWPGIVLIAAALWQLKRIPAPQFVPAASIKGEWAVFAFVFLLAAAAHFWRLDDFPAGLHMDLGEMGWCALRILHEGWKPLEEAFQYPTPFLTDFYQLAAWFSLAGSSLFTLHLFFILMSLAALPFFYLFFRRLAGPATALMALFFMAVMRWQWVEARNPHPSCEASLYLLVMLALLSAGFQNCKPLYLAGAALVSGLGLYAYQSLKALPLLMLALAAFEYFRFPKERKHHQQALRWSGFLLLILALPLLHYILTQHSLGKRESEVFILPFILAEKSLMPLFHSITGAALMFNRQGDMDPFHNLPGHRMLDDGTGILFLLGLGMAWRWRKERQGAYPLIGLVVMALPGLLTTEWWASQRYTGILPFVAYFAAVGGIGLWNALASVFRKNREILWAIGGLTLFAIAAQNAYTYFSLEATDPRCQEASGSEQTFIGEEIARLEKEEPGQFRYFIDSFFQHNPTVVFLGYSAADRIGPFVVSDWGQGKMPRDKDAMVFLTGGKAATWLFMKSLFPNGQGGVFRGPNQQIGLYWEEVPVSDLKEIKRWNRGLKGVYIQSDRWTDQPVTARLDPLVNFASREDFPFTGPPPYRARWSGHLQIRTPGDYQFNVLSSDSAKLWLDGKAVPPEKPVSLSGGAHSLGLDYEKDSGYYMALHLVWKKPDGSAWEVVPVEAFGITLQKK